MTYTGISKSEIEENLKSKGDFMQIYYLSGFLKKDLPFDVKKFVHLKLAEIYERKGMLKDAARIFDSLALSSIAFSEKVKYYTKEAEIYIRAGIFDDTDRAMRKAMNEASSVERDEIYYSIKDFYKKVAKEYEDQLKRNNATKVYEKLMDMRLADVERNEIRDKLIKLYEKLGKFNEAKMLEGLS
ncbi:hypothetical protein CMI44_01915 [Candidatus Pacearchaeota archaeon]|jgi:hypothetical protein|nr:hypothetical protein [Candidatus Pacearchaeota archaeon]|tara:strand:+ start:1240 stop:1794 length:555 start_codon:yes stop_codon:yes gene_type:complete